MADQQQKTGIWDQQQQKPPGKMTARYSTQQVVEAVAFLNDINARLERDPAVRGQLLDLLVGYGSGHGDAHAVASRAAELLRGHPDVLHAFNAYINGAAIMAPAHPPPPESLAATRPRRRPRRSSVPAAEEKPDVSASSIAAAGCCRGRQVDDPQLLQALAFLERVERIAGKETLKKFVKLLGDAAKDEDMDAGDIYRRARGVLGPAHAGLLHEFATRFLPGEHEWEAQQEAAAIATAPKKTRRADDDDSDDGQQHPIRVRVRIKKPRTDDGGCSAIRAAAGVDKKQPRRRGVNGGEAGPSAAAAPPFPTPEEEERAREDKFRRFRELWEFYTYYSTMSDTMARAAELLDGDTATIPLTVAEQFPCREHREFLATYYAGRWEKMTEKLEGDEFAAKAALEAVLESLQRREEEAVAEEDRARRRRDAARAVERLQGLVVHRVRRRPDAGDDGPSGRVPGGEVGDPSGDRTRRHDDRPDAGDVGGSGVPGVNLSSDRTRRRHDRGKRTD